MTEHSLDELTDTLIGATRGDERAADRFMPMLYDELRRLAARYLQDERPSPTLQPTALVNEAYVDLIRIDRVQWADKTHFFAMAARQMRRILTDRARSKATKKRGERPLQVTLSEASAAELSPSLELLALDQALSRLAARYERQANVAELRIFAGMTMKEIAHCLDVSRRTATDDWALARAWLSRELRSG